jgi:phospholipase C
MDRMIASPHVRTRSRVTVSLVASVLATLTLVAGAVPVGAASPSSDKLGKIDHIVVIYEENHSFDILFGGWEGVNGLANADAANTTKVAQNGTS